MNTQNMVQRVIINKRNSIRLWLKKCEPVYAAVFAANQKIVMI